MTVKHDAIEFRGDCSLLGQLYTRSRISMETEAHEGNILIFDTFEALDEWLKTKCNKLWPNCSYCGLRYTENEVTCSGCGGPRGE